MSQQLPKNDVIAHTGSPNTVSEIAIDMTRDYVDRPVLGALVAIDTSVQDAGGTPVALTVLGQVTSLQTRNRWHEDLSLKNYLKHHGRLPNLTEVGDISLGQVQVLGIYRREEGPQGLRLHRHASAMPIGTGRPVRLAGREVVEAAVEGTPGLGYIGYFYGSHEVPAPVRLPHFGSYEEGGLGESYMGGVFGPSGSGKSVIAASLVTLWSRNRELGILILDPASEFATNSFGVGTGFSFDFHRLLTAATGGTFQREQHILTLDQIQLEGQELFGLFLGNTSLLRVIGLGSGKAAEAREELPEILGRSDVPSWWKPSQRLSELDEEHYLEFGTYFTERLARFYASGSRNDKQEEFFNTWQQERLTICTLWDRVAELFRSEMPDGTRKRRLYGLAEDVLFRGAKYILDLHASRHSDLEITPEVRTDIIAHILKRLRSAAQDAARKASTEKEQMRANCLVVIDEAGNYIPQSPGSDRIGRLARQIARDVRELRKYRVGMMFIAQSIALIDKDIYRNMHYRVYGVGLAIGVDAEHMRNREGAQAVDIYRTLPDPRMSGVFSFLVCGPIAALGTTGAPVAVQGFASDDELLRINGFNPADYPSQGAWSGHMAATKGDETPDGLGAPDSWD